LSTSTPSAEDHRRLLRDYADATEQFRATNEVLTALGRSTSGPDAVLDTVVESRSAALPGQHRRDLPD
jgi:hypothetical protein